MNYRAVVLLLLLSIRTLSATAAAGKYRSVSTEPDLSSPLAQKFLKLRAAELQDSQFVSRQFRDVGVMVFPHGRVVGYLRDLWFDFTEAPRVEGKGPLEVLVWRSLAHGVQLRLAHRPDKIYNDRWTLFGELLNLRTQKNLDDLFFTRNPRFVNIEDAKRAVTADYILATELNQSEFAEDLLRGFGVEALEQKFSATASELGDAVRCRNGLTQ